MSDDKKSDFEFGGGLSGAFKGLGEMLERLAKLSESADGRTQRGEFGDERSGIKGVWGVRVSTLGDTDGSGESGWRVEPFGDVQADDEDEVTVAPVREPLVDVFDEDDAVRIVAEMPGVGEEDIECDLEGDVFRMAAERGDVRYFKEILLPKSFVRPSLELNANNGVIEVLCRTRGS